MSAGICPAVVTYCAPGQLPAPPCPCVLQVLQVPTLHQYTMAGLIFAVVVIGIGALWWSAEQQDRRRREHGPQPRYPRSGDDE